MESFLENTRICKLLAIQYPVIQAPMTWITSAELVVAVSNAGGLGVLGPNAGARTITTDVVETGERLRRQIRKVKSLTDNPFGVNVVSFSQANPYSDQCVKVVLEEGVPSVVIVGNELERYTKQMKDARIKVLHRAMPVNIEVARKAEQSGIDALIAVGLEGGGHLGYDRIPTFVLIPQIMDTVQIPVVAGGGIVDGRGMAAALALGAEGIYLGTRFIATVECPAHPVFKRAMLDAAETSTMTCSGTTGVLRALKTPLFNRCLQMEATGSTPEECERVYRPGFLSGMLEGNMTEGTFPCGAGVGLIREVKSAAEVVQSIVREADQILTACRAA